MTVVVADASSSASDSRIFCEDAIGGSRLGPLPASEAAPCRVELVDPDVGSELASGAVTLAPCRLASAIEDVADTSIGFMAGDAPKTSGALKGSPSLIA